MFNFFNIFYLNSTAWEKGLYFKLFPREFAKEKERVESRAGFMALKESQRLERELTGYVDWICRAEDLVLAEDRTTEADREMILEGQLHTYYY